MISATRNGTHFTCCMYNACIGAFGCVYKGILTKEVESGIDEVGVAIKTIKSKLILDITCKVYAQCNLSN